MSKTVTKKREGVFDDEAIEGSGPGKRTSRAIWKGSISFGLVNIPVSLHAGESKEEMSFKLLNSKNLSPDHSKRVDESTGKEVEWNQIVRGYEYEPGEFVVVSDEDLKLANVEATQTVEIVAFVDSSEVSPVYFTKPYYLVPDKRARKSYALLREVLRRSGKIGIAKVVLRSRQYLAAVFPQRAVIVVNLLRYGYELRDPAALDLPSEGAKNVSLSESEIKMAERLVDAMVDHWTPEKYHDTYRDDVMAMIRERVKKGETAAVPQHVPEARKPAQVVNIMELLKKSVEAAEKSGPARRRSEHKRKAG